MTKVKRRPYRSPAREGMAKSTRRRIIGAARRLFLDRGFAATTIAAIADDARVSPETVYAAFGSKRGVLSRLIDVSLTGDDDPKPLLDRPWFLAIRGEPDQARRLKLLAHATRSILDRAGPIHTIIRSASAVDPEVAELRLSHQRGRLAGQSEFVRLLAEAGPLRDGMTAVDAADIYWIQASPEIHHILTVERGWSSDRYEQWLLRSLAAQLLPPDPESEWMAKGL